MAPAPTTRTRMDLLLVFVGRVGSGEWRIGSSEWGQYPAAASFATRHSLFARLHHFLDVAQLFLAEKHLLAHEEGRRAERAAFDGRLGVLDQLRLDVGFLGTGEQLGSVEPGGSECLA